MSRHRAPVRPRYGRIAAFGGAVTVTAVAMLGGVGLLRTGPADAGAVGQVSHLAAFQQVADLRAEKPVVKPSTAPTTAPSATQTPSAPASPSLTPEADPTTSAATDAPKPDLTLPVDSGDGRRVVFSQGLQRVWLVDDDGSVKRSYPVSGSLTDNLHPGTYSVYSRSPTAIGVDDSGTMRLFVRFTRGDTGAAIGFHDIPTLDGKKIEPLSELGTPQSHGCIRQRHLDAAVLWKFAPLGTKVVVV